MGFPYDLDSWSCSTWVSQEEWVGYASRKGEGSEPRHVGESLHPDEVGPGQPCCRRGVLGTPALGARVGLCRLAVWLCPDVVASARRCVSFPGKAVRRWQTRVGLAVSRSSGTPLPLLPGPLLVQGGFWNCCPHICGWVSSWRILPGSHTLSSSSHLTGHSRLRKRLGS